MKRILAILLFSVLFVISLSANNDPSTSRMVSGKIVDKQTGETLAGVKVQIKGTNTFCYSDMDGAFSLSAPTSSEVIIDMVGYESTTVKARELSLGSDIVLNPR
mgnify:CR=1 FL=1